MRKSFLKVFDFEINVTKIITETGDFEKKKRGKAQKTESYIECKKKLLRCVFENFFTTFDDGTGNRMSAKNEKWRP